MKQETAERAAGWWADHLRNGAPIDNGDRSDTGLTTMIMALMLQETERTGQPPGAIDRFEFELSHIIMEKDYWWISVDYHPDQTLELAAKRAGLNLGMATLPWKTTMHIDGDVIRISCGYGAPMVALP